MSNKKYNDPNIMISKVYTRKGDSGKTQLIGGEEVDKNHPRILLYGNLDELNAIIGLCIEEVKLINKKYPQLRKLIEKLKNLQNVLFNLGTMFASSVNNKFEGMPEVSSEDISALEQEIDYFNKSLPNLDSFVLPGGSKINALLHIARTLCRRIECQATELHQTDTSLGVSLSYLNRLSDYFFVLSRWVIKETDCEEVKWDPNKNKE